jgi:hypothetical protein
MRAAKLAESQRIPATHPLYGKKAYIPRMAEGSTRALAAVLRALGIDVIGVVGEIFCRLNSFGNSELVRRLEEAGAEAWMNDLSEWIWYTNADQSAR